MTANGQEPGIDARIESVKALIAGFDESAEACVTAAEQSPSADPRINCTGFLETMDGSSLADYLAHCTVLTDWRDQYVTEAAENPDATGDAEALRRLVDVEYVCGVDALRKRTLFLFTAFDLTRPARDINSLQSQRILNQGQFNEADYRQRQSLLDSYNQQRRRLDSETRRQWDQLEKEIIRQQIDTSVDYGAIDH